MIESEGLNTLLVTTLKKYGTIPVDFLAKVVGRRRSEIQEDLQSLKQQGVITLENENVSLSQRVD